MTKCVVLLGACEMRDIKVWKRAKNKPCGGISDVTNHDF